MMTNKLRIFLAITSTSSSLLIFNCLPAIALAPSSGFDANGIDRDVNTDMWEDGNEDNPALHNWGCSWGLNPPVSRSARVM